MTQHGHSDLFHQPEIYVVVLPPAQLFAPMSAVRLATSGCTMRTLKITFAALVAVPASSLLRLAAAAVARVETLQNMLAANNEEQGAA